MNELVSAVERILGRLEQEVHKDASVLVQFAAGDWHALKAALEGAKATPQSSVAPVASPSVPPTTDQGLTGAADPIERQPSATDPIERQPSAADPIERQPSAGDPLEHLP